MRPAFGSHAVHLFPVHGKQEEFSFRFAGFGNHFLVCLADFFLSFLKGVLVW